MRCNIARFRVSRLIQSTFLFAAVAFCRAAFATPESILLTNGWKLARTADVSQAPEEISQIKFSDDYWIPAVVPGTALTSYKKAGLIPDPYYGVNMARLSQSFYNTNYWYRDKFLAPADFAGRKVWLNFDGINWKADIYLNGSYVGHINGPFIRGKFDVTGLVVPGGTNALAVLIHWSNATVWDAPTFICSESWDFMPAVPGRNVGIYENVYLSSSGPVTIVDPFVTTDIPLPATSPASVTLKVDLTNHSTTEVKGVLKGTIEPDGIQFSQTVSIPGVAGLSVTCAPPVFSQLSITNPALWWPNGYGPQNLHEMTVAFESAAGISDAQSFNFGIRKFGYDTNGHDLYLSVNGQRVMCKGGNWGIPDAMLKYTPQQMDDAVRLHKEMNFTMIRCWHGNNDFKSFYDACDRYGILVWDEWWLNGSQVGIVPNDVPMFNANAMDKIKRLRNHPSIAVWCGENEAVPPEAINKVLKSSCASLDGTRLYVEASNAGVVHGGVTYAIQDPAWFYSKATGFTTEIGSPCIPPIESVRAMIPETNLWPIGGTNWEYHDWDTDIGNKGLGQYIAAVNNRYGPVTGIDDFCRKAQLLNFETFRAIFEAWNSRLWNDCGGVLLWMSHQAWPSTIWQTFDHSFELGGAFFGCKAACEPIHIQWNYDDAKIRLINNTSNSLAGLMAEVQVFNLDGTLKYETNLTGLSMPAESATECGTVLGGNNLALGRSASASSTVAPNAAAEAFDGDIGSRWESQYADPQWIYVDLGAVRSVDTVALRWEDAYGKAYRIQVSTDATTWSDVYSTITGTGGYDLVTFPSTSARYVRMYGTKRGTPWGYSLREFGVYESVTYLNGISGLSSVQFLRLKLKNASGDLLSENFYWRGNNPLSYGALAALPNVTPSASSTLTDDGVKTRVIVTLQNSGEGVAAAARLKLIRRTSGARVLPVFYDANYFFLMPRETKTVSFEFRDSDLAGETPQLMLEGLNIKPLEVPLGGGRNKSAFASSFENARPVTPNSGVAIRGK